MFQGGIFVDVETTGHRSYSSHIIETGAVVLDPNRCEIDGFHTLSNPGEEALRLANPTALAVNKISLEDVRKAPPAQEAAWLFREFLERHPHARIHAYNNDFDIWFLARAPWKVSTKRWGECVMRAALEIMEAEDAVERFSNGKAMWPKLEKAARFFGVDYGVGHRAKDDARCASRIYAEILERREMADEVGQFL